MNIEVTLTNTGKSPKPHVVKVRMAGKDIDKHSFAVKSSAKRYIKKHYPAFEVTEDILTKQQEEQAALEYYKNL